MSRTEQLLVITESMKILAESFLALANAISQLDSSEDDAAKAPVPNPTPASADPVRTVSLEDVRAVLAEKSHDGLTAEVRRLLEKYGASKLSGIDPSRYADLLREAEVLTHAP